MKIIINFKAFCKESLKLENCNLIKVLPSETPAPCPWTPIAEIEPKVSLWKVGILNISKNVMYIWKQKGLPSISWKHCKRSGCWKKSYKETYGHDFYFNIMI